MAPADEPNKRSEHFFWCATLQVAHLPMVFASASGPEAFGTSWPKIWYGFDIHSRLLLLVRAWVQSLCGHGKTRLSKEPATILATGLWPIPCPLQGGMAGSLSIDQCGHAIAYSPHQACSSTAYDIHSRLLLLARAWVQSLCRHGKNGFQRKGARSDFGHRTLAHPITACPIAPCALAPTVKHIY